MHKRVSKRGKDTRGSPKGSPTGSPGGSPKPRRPSKPVPEKGFECSYFGWMSFPIEHVGVISKNFGDARSLYKLARKVAETQLKCQQLNGAATSQVVVGGNKFAVVPRGSVKLSQPLLSARMDTVISIVAMKSQRVVTIMSYSEDGNGSAAIGVDVIQLDKDKHVGAFTDHFNAALAASKESAPPITSTGKGYKGKKPITLTIPSPLGKGQGQGAAAAAPGPRSPGWAPDGLSRMTRVDSKNYFDIAPTLTADGLKHQWDTESVASMLIDDHVGESSGYLQVNLAGRRTNGLGYISVMVE